MNDRYVCADCGSDNPDAPMVEGAIWQRHYAPREVACTACFEKWTGPVTVEMMGRYATSPLNVAWWTAHRVQWREGVWCPIPHPRWVCYLCTGPSDRIMVGGVELVEDRVFAFYPGPMGLQVQRFDATSEGVYAGGQWVVRSWILKAAGGAV